MKLVVANWKMNGSLEANQALLDELAVGLVKFPGAVLEADAEAQDDVTLLGVICPPAAYLMQVGVWLADTELNICLGAQDVSGHPNGARTGEISATMLADLGVEFCIVGHSERRRHCGESDADVAAKALALQQTDIIPIVCVGESLAERDKGQAQEVVLRQLRAVVDLPGINAESLIVAYEPVWAIGTGRAATPADAAAMHESVLSVCPDISVLYGGSMMAGNAASLFAHAAIGGGLIGGASLKAAEFLSIIKAASTAPR